MKKKQVTGTKYSLGNVAPLHAYVDDGTGSFIELNIGEHKIAGLLVWRFSGDERSPRTEEAVKDLVMRGNAHEALVAALREAVHVIELIKPDNYGNGTIVRGRSALAAAGVK